MFSSLFGIFMSCEGVFIVVSSITVQVAGARPRCNVDQITVELANGTHCLDCPKCAVGLGLSPQCGSYTKPGVIVRCAPCEAGVSYSDVYGILACRPCSICGPHEETLRVCTPTQNAICGHCLKGFYREVTGDCKPCSRCCGGSDDKIIEECTNQGLPTTESCKYDLDTMECARKRKASTNDNTDTKANYTTEPAQRAVAARTIPDVYGIVGGIAVIAVVVCGGLVLYCLVRPRWKNETVRLIQTTEKQLVQPAAPLYPPVPMKAGAHDSTINLVTGV